ncbi:FlgD immunoglobulin-like domain containing protein [Streptomyces sp. NPDC053493]|uniref:FlgD immunoglobulin-like domain containing protein n=1 Tax=Streptomyces sp. NPDC053493 TaxID=3365705 RepID=UPI0037D87AAF
MRNRHLARTGAVAVVTALGLATGIVRGAAPAAFADEPPAPAGLTVPAETTGDPQAAVLQQTGDTGFLTGTWQQGFHWTSYADGTTRPVPVPPGYKTVYGSSSDIVAFVGDGRTVLQRDMRDGSERTVELPAGHRLRWAFGDSVVTESSSPYPASLSILSWGSDGKLHEEYGVSSQTFVGILGGDRDGIYTAAEYGPVTLVDHLTRNGRERTRLEDVPYETEVSGAFVSQWHDDGRLTVFRTSDLQKPAHTLTVEGPDTAKLLGVVGDQVLVARPLPGFDSPAYAELSWRVVAVPLTGGPEKTVLERATAMPDFLPDGTMVIARADTGEGTGQGMYTVKPGATAGTLAVTKVADAPGVPVATTRLALAQGRLSTVGRLPGLDGPQARLRTQDLTVTGGTPRTSGPRTDRGANAADFPGGCVPAAGCPVPLATGDGRLVYRKKDGSGLGVVAADGSLPGRGVAVAGTDPRPEALDVSGRYAAVRVTGERVQVVDLDTGRTVHTGPAARPVAALSGASLWTYEGGTEVRAVDVRTGRATGGGAVVGDCAVTDLQAAGTFLYWRCATGEAGAYDTAAQKSVPLPAHTSALLSDGYVAWLKDGELRTTDLRAADPLAAAATRVIGTPRGTEPGRDWTVDRFGGPVAYADADEAVHVVPAGSAGAADSALVAADAAVPAAVDVRQTAWKPRWWLSEPAASWSLTLTHRATGTVVRTLTGGETRGLLGPAWDGKDDGGRPAMSGAYTWTLTAKPADGTGADLRVDGDLLLGGGLAADLGTYKPVTPVRLMDTRSGLGVRKGKVGPAGTVTLAVPQPDATAVVLNVTATGPTAGGFVSVYPYGTQRSAASNLNFTAGQTVPNLVVVPVQDGKVTFYNHLGSVDLIADMAGYFTADGTGSTYAPVTPARLMDTRSGLGVRKGKVGPAGTVTLPVTEPGATAVVLNVTATGPTAGSFVSVYPYGTQRSAASNLNFTAGQTVPNLVVVPVQDGKVTFYNHLGSVDLIADVAGYYKTGAAGAEYKSVTPARLMDTRSGLGVPQGPVGGGQTVSLSVPRPGATAVVLNVTATGPTAGGFVSVYPYGTQRTAASNLNFTAGQTVPNLVVVPVKDGKVTFYNRAGSVHLIADVAGYYLH